MAATQQVFEIAQLFEVSDPNTIESHSVESKRVSTLTGSYKETEFSELPGGSRAPKIRASILDTTLFGSRSVYVP